ncbi:MAG: hypothetical protein HY812_19715 [Planctomycetes bacterium]|nr:hypothetical protein [Planctomycetota bacterium]
MHEQQGGQDMASSEPEGGAAAPGAADETNAAGEVRRLLGELDACAPAPVTPRDVAESLRLNTRILQYVHDAHTRLVKVLERGDRAEMYIQATEALNRTFRRLHESQQELAERLQEERRRNPLLVAVSAVAAGLLVVVAAVFVLGGVRDDLGSEVERLAAARERQLEETDASRRQQDAASSELLETINQGFAANRVLANENRAQGSEIAGLKQLLAGVEEEQAALARARDEAAREAQRLGAENTRLALDLDQARSELVARDLSGDRLREILAGRGEEREAPAAEGAEPPPAARPGAPATAEAPEAPEAEEAGEAGTEAAAADGARGRREPALLPAESPEVQALNAFLRDAGVIDLRALRCEGAADGALVRAVFEVRSEQGFPIGIHEAARTRVTVDPSTMSATLILEEGVSVLRGIRQPFPEGVLRIAIAAVAPGSWEAPGLTEVVRLEPSAAPSEAAQQADASGARAAPPFDPRPTLARLNNRLKQDGRGSCEFFLLDGIEEGALIRAGLHLYEPSGALARTVVAARCEVDVDAAEERVVLRFRGRPGSGASPQPASSLPRAASRRGAVRPRGGYCFLPHA